MGKLKRCEILIMVIIIITLVYGCSNENRRKENNADVLLEEVENLVEQSSQLFQMIKALTGLILETECILCKITDNNTGRKYINPNQIHSAVTAAADVFEAIKKCHPRHEGHWILSFAPPQPTREQP